MKNLLKLASAAVLSCMFLVAHAQQGDGKMMKKDEKMATGEMADGKTQAKMHAGKMHSSKMHNGSTTHKAMMNKDGKMMPKDKM